MLHAKDILPLAIGSPSLVCTNCSLYICSVPLHSFMFGTYEEFVLVSALNWHHIRVGGYFMYGRMWVEVSAQKVAILTKVSCGFPQSGIC